MPATPAEKGASALDPAMAAAPLGAKASASETSGAAADARGEVRASVPLYDQNPAPVYPAAARRRNLEGTVMLEVLVNREGQAAQVRVLRGSGHALLDRSALDGVRRWRFTPALSGGRPQEMWVQVPVRFQLK
jgi:protein TonB